MCRHSRSSFSLIFWLTVKFKHITQKLKRKRTAAFWSGSKLNPHQRKTSRKSAERGYYAKRVIMMILMIMVMNVHNLCLLSVKAILAETGRKWVVNVPFPDKWLHTGGMFYDKWLQDRGSVLEVHQPLWTNRLNASCCLFTSHRSLLIHFAFQYFLVWRSCRSPWTVIPFTWCHISLNLKQV